MNFDDSPEEHAFRNHVREWILRNAPHSLEPELKRSPIVSLKLDSCNPIAAAMAWQKLKYDAGLACIEWPREYGGAGGSPLQQVIWTEEEGVFGKLSLPFGPGLGMAGPTLMAHANGADRARLLPSIASGESIWCQLFSEPGAGSDLAGVRTQARADADGWRITGQKVWTSYAQFAEYGLLLARSDPEAPKHQGLTMFYLRMDSPGVTVRPIRMANDARTFNEVFLDDVHVPDTQRLGPRGGGWRVAVTTLSNERLAGARVPTGFEELTALCRTPGKSGERPIDDVRVRARLASWLPQEYGLRLSVARTWTALARGQEPGPENAVGKLVAARMLQETTRYALELLGEEGADRPDPDQSFGGWFQASYLRAPGLRIEGGTDEILRGVIADRVLSMPPEPRIDKDGPFGKPTSA